MKQLTLPVRVFLFASAFGLAPHLHAAAAQELRDVVAARIAAEYPSLEAIYKQLHANPELSFMETNTAALVAKELRALGLEVTEKVAYPMGSACYMLANELSAVRVLS